MSKRNTITQPSDQLPADQNTDETITLEELVDYFKGHAGTFKSFKTLQGMLNDIVANGAMEGWTKEYADDFMYHFTIISETIFELETMAANKLINKLKAGKGSPSGQKEELLRQTKKLIKAVAKKKAS